MVGLFFENVLIGTDSALEVLVLHGRCRQMKPDRCIVWVFIQPFRGCRTSLGPKSRRFGKLDLLDD